jgi:hypothetical protein
MKIANYLLFFISTLIFITSSFTKKIKGDGKVGWNCNGQQLCSSKCKNLANIRQVVVYREKFEKRRYACFCNGYFNNFKYWADFSNGVCKFGEMDPNFYLENYELIYRNSN